MTFSDLAMAIWRRKWVVVLCALLGALAVFLVGRPDGVLSTRHSATINLVVAGEAENSDVVLYGYVATATDAVSTTAIGELGSDWDVERVYNDLAVSVDPAIGTIQIGVEDISEEAEAVRIVEVFADRLITYATGESTLEHDSRIEELVRRRNTLQRTAELQQRQLESARPVQVEGEPPVEFEDDPVLTTQLVASLGSLSNVLSQLEVLEAVGSEELVPLELVGPPTTTSTIVGGQTLGFAGRLLLAVGLGALLGSVLIASAAAFDTTVFHRRDVVSGTDAPLLSEVPLLPRSYRKRKATISKDDPSSPHSEAFRFLRTQLSRPLEEVERETGDGWVLVVASPNVKAGKSTVTANLAYSFTQVGRSVLVVSGDLRKPTIDEYFQVRPGPGLTELLAEDPLESVLAEGAGETQTAGVTVLRHGLRTEVPGETLRLLGPTIEAARQLFDVILIDSAPMVIGNDFSEISAFADHTLLVARAGTTRIEELEWSQSTCEEFDLDVAGVVLVGAPMTRALRSSRRRYKTRRRLLGASEGDAFEIRASDLVAPSERWQESDFDRSHRDSRQRGPARQGRSRERSDEREQRSMDRTVARRPYFDVEQSDDELYPQRSGSGRFDDRIDSYEVSFEKDESEYVDSDGEPDLDELAPEDDFDETFADDIDIREELDEDELQEPEPERPTTRSSGSRTSRQQRAEQQRKASRKPVERTARTSGDRRPRMGSAVKSEPKNGSSAKAELKSEPKNGSSAKVESKGSSAGNGSSAKKASSAGNGSSAKKASSAGNGSSPKKASRAGNGSSAKKVSSAGNGSSPKAQPKDGSDKAGVTAENGSASTSRSAQKSTSSRRTSSRLP